MPYSVRFVRWHSTGKCKSISDERYKALQGENVHWFCVNCNKGTRHIWQALSKLEARHVKLEEELREMKDSTVSLKKDIDEKINSVTDTMLQELELTIYEKKVEQELSRKEESNAEALKGLAVP